MPLGLRKAKKYDWKDSNLALFGSDLERQVKKEAAMMEPAWAGSGQEVGIRIWRIEQFKVKDWPKEDYGKFFSGDSYIILNTYKPNPDSEELAHDLHFWIGKYSTQDEYGTAAFKTVELDTFLDDVPVQHREVQDNESKLFMKYFPVVHIMEGGAETGFRHVTPEEYQPRLLHVSGTRKAVTVKEVPLNRSRVTSDDVFILDLGTTIYQWNGKSCNKDEKFKAVQFCAKLKGERGTASCETIDEEDDPEESGHDFYVKLSELEEPDELDEDDSDDVDAPDLYQVSDASGQLEFSKVKEGGVSIDDFQTNDVFVLDGGKKGCFVWVGKGASRAEKANGLSIAHKHLMSTKHYMAPVTVLGEGQANEEFCALVPGAA